jgi:hypothetical protein
MEFIERLQTQKYDQRYHRFRTEYFFKTSSRAKHLNNSYSTDLILKLIARSFGEAFYELYYKRNPKTVTEFEYLRRKGGMNKTRGEFPKERI